jgi:hypothetical protein
MTKQELARAALEIKKICSDNKCPSCPFWLRTGGYDECLFETDSNIETPEYWIISQEDIERLERESND